MELEAPPTVAPPLRSECVLAWLAACAVVAILLGSGAAYLEGRFAPLLLLPLGWGVLLGVICRLLLGWFPVPRPMLVTGWLLMCGAASVVAFHYTSYQRLQFNPQLQKIVQAQQQFGVTGLTLPKSFPEFLQYEADREGRAISVAGQTWQLRGALVWVLWTIDALLVISATVLVARGQAYEPYSVPGGGWYRCWRTGTLQPKQIEELNSQLGASWPMEPATYRVWICPANVAPFGLELRPIERTAKAGAWQRHWYPQADLPQLLPVLDAAAKANSTLSTK